MNDAHRVSAVLDSATFGAWKRTGLTLTEVIRRGLDGPDGDQAAALDVASIAASAAIAAAAQTAALIVAAGIPPVEVGRPARPHRPAATRPQAHPAAMRAVDAGYCARVLAERGHGPGSTVTLADVQRAFGCGDKRARRVMHVLTGQGLAVHHERAPGTGQPHTWTIQELASPSSPGDAG